METVTPPTAFPRIAEKKGQGITPGAAALTAGVVGLAVGAGGVLASRLGKKTPHEEFVPSSYTDNPDEKA